VDRFGQRRWWAWLRFIAGGLLVALIVRIGTPFLKGATEIQLTGVALVLTAVLLGSSVLFVTLLFGT
jgi:hypothetical protein